MVDRDIVLVLDRSGSMAWDLSGNDWSYPAGVPGYPDGYCTPPHPTLSRWGAADLAVLSFLSALETTDQTEYVGLVSYASPGNWCGNNYNASDKNHDLTDDYTGVYAAMTSLRSNAIPGGTAIGEGLQDAVEILTSNSARPLAAKTVVLLTDGVHNNGVDPLTVAAQAAAENIVVHTITFSGGAAQGAMQSVAAATGGNHYHAPTAEALDDIFREVALTMPVVLTD